MPEEVQKEQNTLDANSEQWKHRRTKKKKREKELCILKENGVDGCGCVCLMCAWLFYSVVMILSYEHFQTNFVCFCSLLVVSGRHVIHCMCCNAEFEDNVSV